MKNLEHPPLINIFVSLCMALIVWFALAPTQLGGQVTYVIVDGNSMEPRFQFGDLILVRKQPFYQIGDPVTYQNAEMGRYVFHRIVDIQADRFVLQGDHNTWLDNYHPSRYQIIGKLWIHIPVAGKAIQWAREPIHLALGFGLVGGSMTAGMILNPSQKGKRKKNLPTGLGGVPESWLYLSGLLALIFLVLTILAFTRPLTGPAESMSYQQDSQFTYSAVGTPGVYDSNVIQPGEPIFPKLTCFLNLGLVYNINGSGLQSVTGSHQLFARVLDEKSGWQRTFPLNAETAFTGNSYSSQAGLDLCQIEALVASVEEQTGLHVSVYTLQLIAHTKVIGNLGGQPISDSLDSMLKFQFDKMNFHLVVDSAERDPLYTAKVASITGSAFIPNTLNILGLKLTVQTARLFSSFGSAIFLFGFSLAASYFLRRVQSDPVELIRLKYRALLMNVSGEGLPQNLPFLDISSIDDLGRLAERQSTLITHTLLNSKHYYWVQCNGIIYRYVCDAKPGSLNDPRQTQPRIYLPKNIESNYMDAIPVDTSLTSYRVEIDPPKYTQTDETQSVMLHRIKL
jgi:signal peptidase I